MQTAPTRTLQGREVPPWGRWNIDTSHSRIEFIARHMMISNVRGRFREFSGVIDIAEDPADSVVCIVFQAATIDTGDDQRDVHLRSPEFLDVERYPEIRFRSTSVSPADGDRWQVTGDLTIKDVTESISAVVEFCGVAKDPWGNLRAGFHGRSEIDREAFHITWNQMLETGGFLVGKGVKIEAEVEAVLTDES